ncbi:NUDIX hydrolase [Pseudophaeobacter flagellatus]|uniref:NUDIX hydrolase n=1 Tax=Pseudophaeobacter flagellatus TaxID=2899119 RepID=UPI001E56F728|nr:NUDIX hydrolase [Pseudophaeobacter flagellatus]MCD9149490.1 NUDIX hydrolase [Pseudophaeobacter flagellatus]
MSNIFTQAWEEMIKPILFRPKRVQVAALCYRTTPDGKEVLMITSRGTGRWILPKGWPVSGKDGAESALQEAWEEAGVIRAEVRNKAPLGSYEYVKLEDGRPHIQVHTLVYVAEVTELEDDYPEADQRQRKWMGPAEAANLVNEPELQDLLRQF